MVVPLASNDIAAGKTACVLVVYSGDSQEHNVEETQINYRPAGFHASSYFLWTLFYFIMILLNGQAVQDPQYMTELLVYLHYSPQANMHHELFLATH